MDELLEGRTFPEDDLQLVKSIIARHSKCWVERYALMLKVVPETDSEEVSPLDQIVRDGARRMLAAALRAEADAYV